MYSYEYIPTPDRRPALNITMLLIMAAAIALLMPSSQALAAPLRAVGVLAALLALMLASRFVFFGYSYAVRLTDAGAELVITALRGGKAKRRGRVESVVSLNGGKTEKYTRETRRALRARGIVTVNRCVDMFPSESYIFIPAAAMREESDILPARREELAAIRFQPDRELCRMLEEKKDASAGNAMPDETGRTFFSEYNCFFREIVLTTAAYSAIIYPLKKAA